MILENKSIPRTSKFIQDSPSSSLMPSCFCFPSSPCCSLNVAIPQDSCGGSLLFSLMVLIYPKSFIYLLYTDVFKSVSLLFSPKLQLYSFCCPLLGVPPSVQVEQGQVQHSTICRSLGLSSDLSLSPALVQVQLPSPKGFVCF